MKFYTALALSLSLASINAQAELVKWVDAQGKVHYSDSAPANVKAQKLRTSGPAESAAAAPAAPKTLAERELEQKKAQQERDKEEEKAAKENEAEKIKQQNCANARSNLINLENSPAIATYNEKGERTIMDDASRAARIEEARKASSQYCN